MNVEIHAASVTKPNPESRAQLTHSEDWPGIQARYDRWTASVSSAPFIVDRPVQRVPQRNTSPNQHPEHAEHDRLVDLVLTHTLTEDAQLVITIIEGSRDSTREWIIHQVVMLCRCVALNQERFVTAQTVNASHEIVIRDIADVHDPHLGQLRTQHVLEVAHRDGIVRCNQRPVAEPHSR